MRVTGPKPIIVVLVALAMLAAACSDDGDSTTSTDKNDKKDTTATTRGVEEFTGSVDDFYELPDPLPKGEPGALIRTMPVDAPTGEAGLRVMYHSTDAEGDDRAATGLVYHPTGEVPDGGWPILAWAHGTSGLAAKCAPSRAPAPPPAFGTRGVLVQPDYIGLGPNGEIHPYLSAAAEGHSVIDLVAAARSLPEVHAGDDWVVTGVSQGGHAALVTGEQAAKRLPDAHLLGTVAIAPGSQLGETYGDDVQARVIVTMVLVGVAAEDPDVDVDDYLSPEARTAVTAIEEGCTPEITASAGAATSADYFVQDPRTSPVGRAWIEENDPGQVKSESPLLLVQGGQDILVLPARTAALRERLCKLGQVLEEVDVPAGDHNSVTGLAGDQISTWVAARFAGEAAPDDC